MLLWWSSLALAKPCAASSDLLEKWGFHESFDQAFWSGFVRGVSHNLPSSRQEELQPVILAFWQPLLQKTVDDWWTDVVAPSSAGWLADHVECKALARAAKLDPEARFDDLGKKDAAAAHLVVAEVSGMKTWMDAQEPVWEEALRPQLLAISTQNGDAFKAALAGAP